MNGGIGVKIKFIRVTTFAIFLTLISGCGALSFKDSTNSKLDGSKKNQNSQASFELRDKRIKPVKEEFIDCNPKKYKDVLVLLSLSGGGSRAALLSGLSMIEMQNMKLVSGGNVLSEVDLISSVSGGSLAAAYYASSGDPVKTSLEDSKNTIACQQAISGREWNEAEVTNLMSRNYLVPWIGNWFWPDNIFLYWFSTYDRTDMMAQTFADNLYDVQVGGRDLRFADLNPARPNLIINATQGSINTGTKDETNNAFGQPFTFTKEDFGRVCSSIDDYDLSRGVMASATFPGVFNFMTLKNLCQSGRYVHLFDGGNSDNLGLTSIKREIWNLHQSKKLHDYKRIVVILVDAYTDSSGVPETRNDPRHWYDFVVDTNIITATDSLLAKNRVNLLNQFETENVFPYAVTDVQREVMKSAEGDSPKKEKVRREKAEKRIFTDCQNFFIWESPEKAGEHCSSRKSNEFNELNAEVGKKMEFVHIQFSDVSDADLRNQLNNIATSFKLNDKKDPGTGLTDKEAIICAVPTLFGVDVEKAESQTWQLNHCSRPYQASEEIKNRWKMVRDVFDHP